MSSPVPTPDPQAVTDYIAGLEPGVRTIIEAARLIILESSPEIAEHIKWNSPAFFFKLPMKEFDAKTYQRDLLVMNLHRGRILLVFPTGATIKDGSGILTGNYTDGRRIVEITSLTDLQAKRQSLQAVIKKWLELVQRE